MDSLHAPLDQSDRELGSGFCVLIKRLVLPQGLGTGASLAVSEFALSGSFPREPGCA